MSPGFSKRSLGRARSPDGSLSGGSKRRKKSFDVFLRPQAHDFRRILLIMHIGLDAGANGEIEFPTVPNEAHELDIDRLTTSRRKVRAPPLREHPLDDAKTANRSWGIEPDDDIRPMEAQIERLFGVISFANPPVGVQGRDYLGTKRRQIGFLPLVVPVEQIEVHDRKFEARSDLARQSRFSTSSVAQDDESVHARSMSKRRMRDRAPSD